MCILKLNRKSWYSASFPSNDGGLPRPLRSLSSSASRDSVRAARNFLWSECQQVGFWCQHMDLGFQVVSVKQPIKSNSVSFRHMSHCGTSSLDYHFDHCFIVFQNVQLRLSLRRMCVGGYAVHFALFINFLSSCDMLGLGFEIKNCPSFLEAGMFGLSFVFG